MNQEDLNWLYFGDENQQIIDKLTNTYDENLKLKKYIETLLARRDLNFNIDEVFELIIRRLEIKNKSTLKNITEDQINRLYVLKEKFNI
jgi:hypothetical protein